MDDRSRNNGIGMLMAFLGGAAVGGVAALLLAPRSGRETREQISATVRRQTEATRRIPGAVKEAGSAAKEAFAKALE